STCSPSFFPSFLAPRALLSFPTRRSSDLCFAVCFECCLQLVERHQPVHLVHFGPRLNPNHAVIGSCLFSCLQFDTTIEVHQVCVPVVHLRLINGESVDAARGYEIGRAHV